MNSRQLNKILKDLALTHDEVSVLLDVNIRTVRRWVNEPKEMTVSAKEALIAWHKLWQHNIDWMPAGVARKEIIKVKTKLVRE